MSDQDKINAIVSKIQIDSQALLMFRALVSLNLPAIPSAQLDAIMAILGIPQS